MRSAPLAAFRRVRGEPPAGHLQDLLGVQVLEKTFQTKGSGAIRILTRRLTPGSYTLHVRTAKGKYTQAFVKN